MKILFIQRKQKKEPARCHFRARTIRRDFQANRISIAQKIIKFTLILVFVFGLIFGFDTRVRAEINFGALSANYNASEHAF